MSRPCLRGDGLPWAAQGKRASCWLAGGAQTRPNVFRQRWAEEMGPEDSEEVFPPAPPFFPVCVCVCILFTQHKQRERSHKEGGVASTYGHGSFVSLVLRVHSARDAQDRRTPRGPPLQYIHTHALGGGSLPRRPSQPPLVSSFGRLVLLCGWWVCRGNVSPGRASRAPPSPSFQGLSKTHPRPPDQVKGTHLSSPPRSSFMRPLVTVPVPGWQCCSHSAKSGPACAPPACFPPAPPRTRSRPPAPCSRSRRSS